MTRPPKFTIAALMGLVALCAATFAALRTSSPHSASAMVSVTVLVLLGSVVASLRGRHPAAWSGFAIFGCGYFLLTFTSPFRDVVRPHLLTSIAIVESYRHLHPEVRVEVTDLTPLLGAGVPMNRTTLATGGPPQMPAPQFVAVAGGGPRPIIDVTIMGNTSTYIPSGPNQFYSFECSAHAAFTLAFAGLGWLFASRVTRQAATTSASDSKRKTVRFLDRIDHKPSAPLSLCQPSLFTVSAVGQSVPQIRLLAAHFARGFISETCKQREQLFPTRLERDSHGAFIHVINERIDRQHKAGK